VWCILQTRSLSVHPGCGLHNPGPSTVMRPTLAILVHWDSWEPVVVPATTVLEVLCRSYGRFSRANVFPTQCPAAQQMHATPRRYC
jgi:hypothetical protein